MIYSVAAPLLKMSRSLPFDSVWCSHRLTVTRLAHTQAPPRHNSTHTCYIGNSSSAINSVILVQYVCAD